MAEDGDYIGLTEECARCLLKARNSKDDADRWSWLLLGKSWLNLIDVRRSVEQTRIGPNIRTRAARAAHA